MGFCSSEALVTSSFLPRSLWKMRGGSEGTKTPPNNNAAGLTCVLQVPRTSLGVNGDPEPKDSGGSKNQKKETVAFAPKRNGSSTVNKKLEDKIFDVPLPAQFVAETNLPTDVGQFRLRAYRTAQSGNEFTGNEPCVIYLANKPPFGKSSAEFQENVPIRIHDQCLTSEVFRSQR